jgi:hypothetical protein
VFTRFFIVTRGAVAVGFCYFGLAGTEGVADLRHEFSQADGVARDFTESRLAVNVDELAHGGRNTRVAYSGRKLQRSLRFEARNSALVQYVQQFRIQARR